MNVAKTVLCSTFNGLSGGIVYNALIRQAAVKTRVEMLLTLNSEDFRRLQMIDDITVVEP